MSTDRKSSPFRLRHLHKIPAVIPPRRETSLTDTPASKRDTASCRSASEKLTRPELLSDRSRVTSWPSFSKRFSIEFEFMTHFLATNSTNLRFNFDSVPNAHGT